MKRFLFAPRKQDIEGLEAVARTIRDRLIIRLPSRSGLRECELVGDTTHPGLRVQDIDFNRARLMVHGKGWATGKVPPAELPCDKLTLNLLKEYLASSKITEGRIIKLSKRQVRRVVKQLATKAKVPHAENYAPHRLRAYFITEVVERYGLEVGRRLARHKTVGTTQAYSFLRDEGLEQKYRQLFDTDSESV
jgi:site-specific recombinase XerD